MGTSRGTAALRPWLGKGVSMSISLLKLDRAFRTKGAPFERKIMLTGKLTLLLATIAALALTGCMGLSPYSPTRNAMDALVGHNIKEMLPSWKGATPASYRANAQENAYVYTFGYHPGHYVTQGYRTLVAPNIIEEGSYDDYVPTNTDCVMTFFTDRSGTITRYIMKTNGAINNNSCGHYVSGWGF
ncbi:hypothetical protein PQR67_20775 [Paraburkholderia fungorum]|uniref:hypothetical protein n=1 Tax=Paraburkholderia fungorum TaxID=134537 RepID=UPI0038BB74FF